MHRTRTGDQPIETESPFRAMGQIDPSFHAVVAYTKRGVRYIRLLK